MRVLVATGNAGKVREMAAALSSLDVVSTSDFSEITPPTVVEDGSTYFENALKKAVAFHRVYQVPVLADDSGVEVDALGGRPGLHSARYGGPDLTWPERCRRLLNEVGPTANRGVRFRCVLCFFDGELPRFFQGTVEGELLTQMRGEGGFGYDPVFFCPELGKSFAEATTEEKQRVSHRGRAIAAFKASLSA